MLDSDTSTPTGKQCNCKVRSMAIEQYIGHLSHAGNEESSNSTVPKTHHSDVALARQLASFYWLYGSIRARMFLQADGMSACQLLTPLLGCCCTAGHFSSVSLFHSHLCQPVHSAASAHLLLQSCRFHLRLTSRQASLSSWTAVHAAAGCLPKPTLRLLTCCCKAAGSMWVYHFVKHFCPVHAVAGYQAICPTQRCVCSPAAAKLQVPSASNKSSSISV
jgi:hypothetical protein